MSRIGKQPIALPSGVEAGITDGVLRVKGPKGTLSRNVSDGLRARVEAGKIVVEALGASRAVKARHGLFRSLAANMVEGVAKGYTRELEIQGVGFRVALNGNKLTFSLGFASPIEVTLPDGIEAKVADNVNLSLFGIDKQQLGDFAAGIKALFPAEPYKGKGIRFKGEQVRRKVGKTVA